MASSSTTLSLCSSLTNHCKITHHNQNSSSTISFCKLKPVFSNTTRFAFSSSLGSSSLSTGPAFSHIPKFSQSGAPAIEAEAVVLDAESVEVVDVALEKPKREEVFAVVMIGSRQYIVFPGRYLYTQRLKGAKPDDKIILNKVLLVGTKESTYIGKPVVTNAAVHAVVEEQGLNKKVIVFKYKKKKNYRRNIGHRQPNTRIRITGITGFQDFPASPNISVPNTP